MNYVNMRIKMNEIDYVNSKFVFLARSLLILRANEWGV